MCAKCGMSSAHPLNDPNPLVPTDSGQAGPSRRGPSGPHQISPVLWMPLTVAFSLFIDQKAQTEVLRFYKNLKYLFPVLVLIKNPKHAMLEEVPGFILC